MRKNICITRDRLKRWHAGLLHRQVAKQVDHVPHAVDCELDSQLIDNFLHVSPVASLSPHSIKTTRANKTLKQCGMQTINHLLFTVAEKQHHYSSSAVRLQLLLNVCICSLHEWFQLTQLLYYILLTALRHAVCICVLKKLKWGCWITRSTDRTLYQVMKQSHLTCSEGMKCYSKTGRIPAQVPSRWEHRSPVPLQWPSCVPRYGSEKRAANLSVIYVEWKS